MSQARKIGFWTCTALVVGNTIGMGIFMLPASLAPFGFNALLGWGVTLVGCLVLASAFSQLARALPAADGPYGYMRGQLGELPAYVAMFCYWVSCWITNAALAIGVVSYLVAIDPAFARINPSWLAMGLVWSVVLVNLMGVRTGGRVQIITATLKLLPMLAVAVLGLWVLVASPAAYVAHPPTTPLALPQVMAAGTIALFAMLGFESATVPANDVENPGRTIPRATMVGTLVVAVIYLIVSSVPMLLIGQDELGSASAPFALLIDRITGVGFGRYLALFVVISGLGALNGWTLLVGELTRTMASNGVLPTPLARSNSRGAPAMALLVTAVMASVMVAMNYSQSLVGGFTFLSTVVTAANLPVYLLCSLALAVWWQRNGRAGGLRVALIALAGIGYSLFAFVGMGHEPFLMALGLAAASLPIYALTRLQNKRSHA